MGITSNQKLSLIKNRIANKQVAWCGYNNTTGLEQMDYLISDKYSILENEVNLYSEKIIRLENIWNCHCGFSEKREFINHHSDSKWIKKIRMSSAWVVEQKQDSQKFPRNFSYLLTER